MSRLLKLTTLAITAALANTGCLAANQAHHDKVIMFDLHDVILEFSTTQALSGFWQIPKKIKFLKSVKKYFNAKKCGQHVAIEKFALNSSLGQKYNTAVLQTINPHEPNAAMVKLIKRLKNNGVKVYICSNIGEKSYQELVKRYPDAFNQIDGCICSRPQDDYPKKGLPKFWNQVPALISAEITEIPFVDNDQANLDAAQKICPRIRGILFQNPQQLECELIRHRLL